MKLKSVADKFVRVRLARIESLDLNVFDFDYDLTMMVFFLSADGRVYARYGGRCEDDPDQRQSLAGLRYTMQSVLQVHNRPEKEFAQSRRTEPVHIGTPVQRRGEGGCIHCHQVNERQRRRLIDDDKWTADLAFRFPPPDNLGLKLEVDRGNVVKQIAADSPAAQAGLKAGDRVERLNGVPIHSFGDATYALDLAPQHGAVEVVWLRDEQTMTRQIDLPADWQRTDISWRRSLQDLVAAPRVYGKDLSAAEKRSLGLDEKQLAFQQQESLSTQAQQAGIRPGDIVLGFDDSQLQMGAYEFLRYVRRNYVQGEVVTVNVLRNGKPLNLRMQLR